VPSTSSATCRTPVRASSGRNGRVSCSSRYAASSAARQAILQAIADAAFTEGYGILLGVTNGDPRRQRAHASRLRSREAEGLICIGDDFPTTRDGWLRSGVGDLPAVTVSETSAVPGVSSVIVDAASAAGDALEEQWRQGHQDIAIVCDGSDEHIRQVAGLRRVAERHRLSARVRYLPTDGFVGSGVSAAFELFTGSSVPTAILCLNEMIAAGITGVARQRRFRVPEDVSIIALEEVGLATAMEPALSTMSPPCAAIGEASVKLVLDRVRGVTSTARHVGLKYEFVERLSTARRAWARLA
jgi:DNA-binding LacI/PurR family transcriptional regulator